MKRFILSLLLAGIAGAALAQNTPANVFVLGPHVLKQGVFTPVDLVLLNPTSVAGLQATLSYDPNVVEIPDPATEPALADFKGKELNGGVIQNGFGAVNYSVASPIPGMKAISFAIAASAGATQTGKVLTLMVRPAAGATALKTSAFTSNPDDFVVSNETSDQITTAAAQDGLFVVGSSTVGSLSSLSSIAKATASVGISGSPSTDENSVWVVGDDQNLRSLSTDLTQPAQGNFATGVNVGGTVQGRPVPVYNADGSVAGVIVATTNGKIHRINTDGTIQWSKDINTIAGTTGLGIASVPAIANLGRIYVTDTSDTVRSLDFATGDPTAGTTPVPLSTGQAAGTQGLASPSVFLAPGAGGVGSVVVGGADGKIQIFNADLLPQKSLSPPAGDTPGAASSAFIIQDPTQHKGLGIAGNQNGHVYTFDVETGQMIGNYNSNSPVQSSPFAVGQTLQAYVVNSAGELHTITIAPALDSATGANSGVKFAGGAGGNQSPVVIANNIWFGDKAGTVYKVPVGGAQTDVLSLPLATSALSSPAAPNGAIVFTATDGTIIALPTQ
jgi:hypothetical protein